MMELLALPASQHQRTALSAWVDQIAILGHKAVVTRESSGVSWIEVGALRVRGYAVMEGSAVEAINFEFNDPDPAPSVDVVERAATSLAWELHEDEEDDTDED